MVRRNANILVKLHFDKTNVLAYFFTVDAYYTMLQHLFALRKV